MRDGAYPCGRMRLRLVDAGQKAADLVRGQGLGQERDLGDLGPRPNLRHDVARHERRG